VATTNTLKFKKATKHTVVYETTSKDVVVPVESVYVSKQWLLVAALPGTVERTEGWPTYLQMTVSLNVEVPA